MKPLIVCLPLLLSLGLCGCLKGPVQEQPTPKPQWGIATVVQAPSNLLPVQRRAQGERRSAEEVWRGLPVALEKDPETRDLPKKLLAAEEVHLESMTRLDSNSAPAGGPLASSKAFLGLWPTTIRPEKDLLQELPDYYAIGLGYALFQGEPARIRKNGDTHLRVVVFAINDHFLRKDVGYLVVHGNIAGEDRVRKTPYDWCRGVPRNSELTGTGTLQTS